MHRNTQLWGAFFDLYEHNLRTELGEEGAGVAELRGKLRWVDDSRRYLGFSEHHPVDNLGRDGYRSQANRRVEVLFFDDGEEPDIDLAASAPEQSELYLPGVYQRRHLGGTPNTTALASPQTVSLFWEVINGLYLPNGTGQKGYASYDGRGRVYLNQPMPRRLPTASWRPTHRADPAISLGRSSRRTLTCARWPSNRCRSLAQTMWSAQGDARQPGS